MQYGFYRPNEKKSIMDVLKSIPTDAEMALILHRTHFQADREAKKKAEQEKKLMRKSTKLAKQTVNTEDEAEGPQEEAKQE